MKWWWKFHEERLRRATTEYLRSLNRNEHRDRVGRLLRSLEGHPRVNLGTTEWGSPVEIPLAELIEGCASLPVRAFRETPLNQFARRTIAARSICRKGCQTHWLLNAACAIPLAMGRPYLLPLRQKSKGVEETQPELTPRARPMLSQLNMYARCRVAHTQNTPTLVIGPTITPGSQLIHSQ